MNLISTLIKRRYLAYKRENQKLVKLLTLLALLLSPLLMLVAPLPGYLLYTNAPNSWAFTLAAIVFFFLFLFNFIAFYRTFSAQERAWLRYAYGGTIPLSDYLKSLIQALLPSLCLILVALTRLERVELQPLAFYLLCCGVLLYCARLAALRLLSAKKGAALPTMFTTRLKLLWLITHGSWLRITLLGQLLLVGYLFSQHLATPVFWPYYVIVGSSYAWLALSLNRQLKARLHSWSNFLYYLQPAAYGQACRLINGSTAVWLLTYLSLMIVRLSN